MKIFEATADQITRLKDFELVDLLRRLISAELKKNGIPLGSGTAPAQITIADGGEDGRVSWSDGPSKTDFIPHRYTIFQCKKSAPSPSCLKEETWTKASQGKGKTREINEALAESIKNEGAYIVITGSPVVGVKVTRRIEAVKQGIREAGEDPSKLSAIDIIDANKLATWTTTHPSVALWLNSTLSEIHLHGFRNYDEWSLHPNITETKFQCIGEKRLLMRGAPIRAWKKDREDLEDLQSVETLRTSLEEFFKAYGRTIRIIGPSGYGKTRLAHALFGSEKSGDYLDPRQIVHVFHDDVKHIIVNIAREIALSGSPCILIVDDCPDEVHTRLWEAMGRGKANSILLTIGVETKSDSLDRNLVIELKKASDELIEGIASDISGESTLSDNHFVRELAQGFPSMAVLAAHAARNGDEQLSSAEALVDRIVWGEKQQDQDALFALQTLSLFTALGVENEPSKELNEASEFIDMKPQTMFRLLSSFRDRGIVGRLGDYALVQPIPLAMRLANGWLASMPRGTLERLFREISPTLQLRLAGRLRWVSWSTEVNSAAERLLGELLPTQSDLNTEHGSMLLDRFVHLAPDRVMEHLNNLLGDQTLDELLDLSSGRRHTVWALEKLAFRKETFTDAASLLLKLGAAENESWGNNSSGQFKSLYKLHLSGTEAEPPCKLALLDNALLSEDLRIRSICVDALENMLYTDHFSRSGGQERIGTSEPLSDWQPKTYGEIFDYYRSALVRLKEIAFNNKDPLQATAINHIGNHLRGLFSIPAIYEDILETINGIRAAHPRWHRGLSAVSDWLYFDRESAPQEYINRLRALYDDLMPSEHLERILIYSAGWRVELHDPDVPYKEDGDNDYYYADRMIESLITTSPMESAYFESTVKAFTEDTYHNAGSTLTRIAMHVTDPHNLVAYTLGFLGDENGLHTTASMLRSILYGINKVNGEVARLQLEIILSRKELSPYTADLISSVGVDDRLFGLLIDRLRAGDMSPWSANSLGHLAEMKSVSSKLITELIDVLIASGAEGGWAAVDFLTYFLHNNKKLSATEALLIKSAVINPNLLLKEKFGHMDAYHWKELTKKLFEDDFLDPNLGRDLTQFITSMIDIPDYSIQLSFSEYARDILKKMIDAHPEIVWTEYTERLKLSPTKKHRLATLYGTDIGNPAEGGVLDYMPLAIIEPWMLEDKSQRLPVILSWIKIFENNESTGHWNSKFVIFLERHISNAEELAPLISRLTTGSWWGSYANKLNPIVERLEALAKIITNPAVSRWAVQTRYSLLRAIERARHDEENRDIGFRL